MVSNCIDGFVLWPCFCNVVHSILSSVVNSKAVVLLLLIYFDCCTHCCVGVVIGPCFCVVLSVLFGFVIISLRKRELVTLLKIVF